MAAGGELPGGPRGRDRPSTSSGWSSRPGKRFGDPIDPLLLSVRSGAAISMPGMMDTILNLGLNDESVRGLAARDRQRAVRQRLLPPADPDVRRGRRRDRRPSASRTSSRALKARRGVDADVELDRRRPRRADRRPTRGSTRARAAQPFPQDAARAAAARGPRGLRVLELAARRRVPAGVRDPGRPRHGRERRADGVREQERRAPRPASASRRNPSTGEPGLYGEFLLNAQGEDVVAGIRTPQPIERLRELMPGGVRRARRDDRPRSSATTATCRTSSSPSRTAGSTSSRRARRKRTAAAAVEGRGRDGRRRPDRPRRGDPPDRPGAARPAAASDARPDARRSTSPRPG